MTTQAHVMNAWLWCMAPAAVFGPALTCLSPRIMAPLFIAFGLGAGLYDIAHTRRMPRIDPTVAILSVLLMVWGAASSLWSIVPDATWEKLAQFASVFGVFCILKPQIDHMEEAQLEMLGKLLLTGLSVGLGVYYFEWIGWPERYTLYDMIRGFSANDLIDNRQNKPIVMLALWCALCFPFVRSDMRKLWMLLASLTAFATFFSPSDSALLVLIGLTPIIAISLLLKGSRTLIMLAVAGSIAFSFTMLPLARAVATETQFFTNQSLPSSVRARLQIWDQAARRTLERPYLGWGLDSSPALPNRGETLADILNEAIIAHLHPHNAPLQIWFELGIVGMIFLSAFLAVIGIGLLRLETPAARIFGLILFLHIFALTLSIWGIWQTWFMALLAFACLMTIAGIRRYELPH